MQDCPFCDEPNSVGLHRSTPQDSLVPTNVRLEHPHPAIRSADTLELLAVVRLHNTPIPIQKQNEPPFPDEGQSSFGHLCAPRNLAQLEWLYAMWGEI